MVQVRPHSSLLPNSIKLVLLNASSSPETRNGICERGND